MKPIGRAWRHLWLGDKGERAAARFLRRQGLRIMTRGYRTRWGEIDLVARQRDTLVFVEVKTRRWGEPAEAVTAAKQKRLARAAARFLRQFRLEHLGVSCRFDVVAIIWPEEGGAPQIQHLVGAFEAGGVAL